ncbi:MAG: YgeY family selenium metabolism-linked hydrolase [Deltaproteobacteria bacterium]|jgi:putative selenium metabolism hydrolase|nr:YgeY family selenium metabolism-linked hydrolase [Deltaproteobacteria bacterium]
MLNETEKTMVADLAGELIRLPSYSGQEGQVAQAIGDFMKRNGFDDVHVDRYGSVTGTIRGDEAGPSLLYDGHIDTVPVPDESAWTRAPFGGEIVDQKLYGRGASDMKGAVAAMLVAAALFKKGNQGRFKGQLSVAGVVHEECFEGIAAREISARVNPDLVVIGEASELNLKIGQRGRAEIVCQTRGVPAHSANPDKGVNAVELMFDLFKEIAKIEAPTHPTLGRGVLVLTDIISNPYPGASVVPSLCRATYDRRLLVGETKESVLAPLLKVKAELEKNRKNFQADVFLAQGKEQCHTGNVIEGERFFPGWVYDEKEEFVQKALQALQSVGLTPSLTQYSFCTNGSHYAGEKGIKTIGFGPSRENLAHTIDEHVELSQLHLAAEGYLALSRAFLS